MFFAEIVGEAKTQRLRWASHLEGMGDDRGVGRYTPLGGQGSLWAAEVGFKHYYSPTKQVKYKF